MTDLCHDRMYRMGGIVLCCALVVGATASVLLKFWLKKLNKAAEERDHEQGRWGDNLTFRFVL